MAEEKQPVNKNTSLPLRPVALEPFTVQVQNIVPIEIMAKRFPVDITGDEQVNVQLNLIDLQVDAEHQQAQVIIEIKVEPAQELRPFEISFQMIGLFSYTSEYSANQTHQFLQQGSMNIMLPFARELVFSLCSRLQIPPVILSLINLELPSEAQGDPEDTSR